MSQRDICLERAANILQWTTPSQFQFITSRYNHFIAVANDRGESAKFWTSLGYDWSLLWDFSHEIMKTIKDYYTTMSRLDIDNNIHVPSGQQRSSNAAQSVPPHHCQPPVTNGTSVLRDRLNDGLSDATHPTDNIIVVEVPGFAPSEVRATFIAGNLLIRAEKLDVKGKGKENEGFSHSPSQIIEAQIELPLGVQVEDIKATVHAGCLTIQFPSSTARFKRIVVEDLGEDNTNER